MSVGHSDDKTWVVGAGGLLGGALTRALVRRGSIPFRPGRVDWSRVDASRPALADALGGFFSLPAGRDRWRIAWCAGAGVTGAAAVSIEDEVATFEHFLGGLRALAPRSTGTLFVASSAGGVYAGSVGAPFSEADPPIAISAYGKGKLAVESLAARFAHETGHRVIIGRIANLYGPGQDLGKSQGLISHLCRSMLTRKPISIYVSLDTIRDYLFVDDCAEMIADALDAAAPPASALCTKIFASQRGTTVAELIGECGRIFKKRPSLILGTSPNARFQAKDLRLTSAVWPELDRRQFTPLPAGIAATASSLLRTFQQTGR